MLKVVLATSGNGMNFALSALSRHVLPRAVLLTQLCPTKEMSTAAHGPLCGNHWWYPLVVTIGSSQPMREDAHCGSDSLCVVQLLAHAPRRLHHTTRPWSAAVECGRRVWPQSGAVVERSCSMVLHGVAVFAHLPALLTHTYTTCTCARLCVGAPSPMPAWVWCDVRSVFQCCFVYSCSTAARRYPRPAHGYVCYSNADDSGYVCYNNADGSCTWGQHPTRASRPRTKQPQPTW